MPAIEASHSLDFPDDPLQWEGWDKCRGRKSLQSSLSDGAEAEKDFLRILRLSNLDLGDAAGLVRRIFVTIAENLGIHLERALLLVRQSGQSQPRIETMFLPTSMMKDQYGVALI